VHQYRMNSILKVLDRNEEVEILYHEKPKALLKPINKKVEKIKETELFGCMKEDSRKVNDIINGLRSLRYDN